MAARIVDAGLGERVYRRGSRDLLPVRTDGIEAHLVGGDEENLAAHECASLLILTPSYYAVVAAP
jgi:hypothetical protein